MKTHCLQSNEIPLIWQIDRREIVENNYYLDHGDLLLKPGYFDMQAGRQVKPSFIHPSCWIVRTAAGCVLAHEIDPELFELEPEDIHLEYVIS